MAKQNKSIFGPAILVTAAFIGPGTVLLASRAGANYGFSLLWAVAFSVFAAIVLQEMTARLGIVTGDGLSQSIKRVFTVPIIRWSILTLVLSAIFIGNAAYQTGNILGGAYGISVLADREPPMTTGSADSSNVSNQFGQENINRVAPSADPPRLSVWIVLIGLTALLLILIGRFDLLQNVLTLLVVVMSGLFLIAAILTFPNLADLLAGLVPNIPEGAGWIVVGLIGTTVVPYNLFLHASAAAERWPPESVKKTDDKERAVKISRRDTSRSILVGGLITSAILITASAAFHDETGQSQQLRTVKDVALLLEPAIGSWAKWMFAAGLLAAGLTSAITAPVAAAYAAAGCFGWPNKLSDWRLKAAASVVVLFGTVFAVMFAGSPAEAIVLAQVANGILLPVIAVFLLVILNRPDVMFRFRNTFTNNVLGLIVLIVVALIAAKQLTSVVPKVKELMNQPQARQRSIVDPEHHESFFRVAPLEGDKFLKVANENLIPSDGQVSPAIATNAA